MKNTKLLTPTITTLKTRGRITGYQANVGDVGAIRGTKQEAVALCEQRVLDALERMVRGPVTVVVRGYRAFVFPSLNGWDWQIIEPNGRLLSTYGPAETREEAVRHARHHTGQMAWSLDVEDDQAFVEEVAAGDQELTRELLSYFAWQRDFRRLRDEHPEWTSQQVHQTAQSDLRHLRRA